MKNICIRECFVHGMHFVPGDILPSHLKPNKHFAKDGERVEVDEPVIVAGDDPRGTEEIAQDIEARGGKITKKTRKNRKKLFQMWIEIKDQPLIDGATESKRKPTVPKKVEGVTPFSKLSPDAIDSLGCKDLGELYGITWQGKSKETVIEEILAKEA